MNDNNQFNQPQSMPNNNQFNQPQPMPNNNNSSDNMDYSFVEPKKKGIRRILAIDQASVDLVYAEMNNMDLVERIESRHGLHQLTAMRELKMGNDKYELISVD